MKYTYTAEEIEGIFSAPFAQVKALLAIAERLEHIAALMEAAQEREDAIRRAMDPIRRGPSLSSGPASALL